MSEPSAKWNAEVGHAARDELLKARTFKLNEEGQRELTRIGTAKEQLQAIADYLRNGCRGPSLKALYRLGLDPWSAKGIGDSAFQIRAAAALDLLADGLEQ